MSQLEPVLEEPIDEEDEHNLKRSRAKNSQPWKKWRWIIKNHISLISPPKKSNIKILLSVLGCPLSPVPIPPLVPSNISSKAQYIIQQFRGATQMGKSTKNLYASGNVTMAMMTPGAEEKDRSWSRRRGSFVVWEMDPGMWLLELVVDGIKIVAGSNGSMAWRHTPWVGTHSAPGGARPLRRALQGLNPSTITSVFSTSQFMGEKEIDGENCFVLMLEVDQPSLTARGDGTAEIIKHIMVGYFSQRTGLLVQLDDFQLSRFRSPGTNQPIFWETTMASHIRDYRPVDGGVVIAHSGRSIVNLVRFGRGVIDDNERTRMEEEWSIHDIAFNVPGLTGDSFIPPKEVRGG